MPKYGIWAGWRHHIVHQINVFSRLGKCISIGITLGFTEKKSIWIKFLNKLIHILSLFLALIKCI